MPDIKDVIPKLKWFQWKTTLDLNIDYYHIQLCPESKKICTIVLSWAKYKDQKLPMGLSNSPDIFQENISSLFRDFDYVREDIDDLCLTTCGSFIDYIKN